MATFDLLLDDDLRAPFLPDPQDTMPWEEVRDRLASSTEQDVFEAVEHAFESPHVRWNDAIFAYASQPLTPGRPVPAAAMDLSTRIHADFAYRPGVTGVAAPVATVFEQRSGVCEDFAHLMIACLRSHGLAARYVSGYLLTRPAAGQPRRIGADASHAWCAVYVPEYDFVDIDPTNDLLVKVEHPTLAWGRDFGDVSPLKGVVFGGGAHHVEVSVEVAPVDDDAT